MSRILIIEDDPAISAIERDYLELSDFEADIADDGMKGLAMADGGGYDLVLLDLMLPGLDGFSVCRKLREKTDIPILLVTARHEDVDKIRGWATGPTITSKSPFRPACWWPG
jgi:DNA-binding response OmpR family regulator